jgi:hypothetical protein
MSYSKRQWEEWDHQTRERQKPESENLGIIWSDEAEKRELRKAHWKVASTALIVVAIVAILIAVVIVAAQIISRYAP